MALESFFYSKTFPIKSYGDDNLDPYAAAKFLHIVHYFWGLEPKIA